MRRLCCAVFALALGAGCRGEQVSEQRLALEGSGWVTEPDAGGSGMPDAGSGGMPDAGSGGMPDGGSGGSGMPDGGSGAPDGGMPDGGSGAPDGGMPDGGSSPDAGVVDAPVADAPHDGGHGPPGTIPYDGGTGRKTWWKDTDGVMPELAGCHVEYAAQGCPGDMLRSFGELCQGDGNTLIETNPGAGICHDHAGDIGHPYVVPCDKWCKNQHVIQTPDGPKRRGVAAAGGRCQIVAYMPCENIILDSARCLCDGTDVQPPEGYPGN